MIGTILFFVFMSGIVGTFSWITLKFLYKSNHPSDRYYIESILASQGLKSYEILVPQPLKNLKEIPYSGKRLIVVATVEKTLHIRIFGVDGESIVDADENDYPKLSYQIDHLKRQIERESLRAPYSPYYS